MAKKVINVGTNANPTGDSLKNAFTKVNDNFTELYNALGLGDGSVNVGAFEFSGSTSGIATMSTTDSSSILIDQAVTVSSNLTVGGDILPSTANGGDLGSSTLPFRSLYVSNNTIYIGGNALKIDSNGDLTLNNNRIVQENGEYLVLDNLTDVSANSPSVGDVLTWNGGSWVNGGQVDLGKFKIANNNLGTVDNPNTGGWGGYGITIDPGNGSDAAILIPSLAGQAGGSSLQIYNIGNAASVLSLWGRGNVQITTGQGVTEKTFTFEGDSLFFPDGSLALTDSVLNNGLDADIKGSVFADDSTIMVDGVNGVLRANVNVANTWSVTTGNKTWSFIYGDPDEGTIPALELPGILRSTGNSTALLADTDDQSSSWGIDIDAGNAPYSVDIGEIGGGIYWRFDGNGSIIFPDTTTQFTAWTGVADIARNIESEGDVSIKVNLADSTQRIWRFGEDGDLTLPANSTIQNSNIIWTKTDNDTNISIVKVDAALEFAEIISFEKASPGNNRSRVTAKSSQPALVEIGVESGSIGEKVWGFNSDGSLNLPGAIQLSNGAQIFNTVGVDNSITIGATGTNGTSTFNGTGFFIDDVYFDKAIQEKFSSLQDATGVVTHNCANGHIFYHTSPDANWTVNLTNFSLVTNYATAVTIIISQGGTGYYPNALQIAGAAQTINWQGNATPTPSSNRVDVVTFSILLTGGGYTVLGQLTGF